jgi:hypothetical protein
VLDICAHEIGHGICQSTANIVYYGESGAINESLSDIWAACVEYWAAPNKQRWQIGEDLGSFFRSMSNPNLRGQPDTYGGGAYWTGIYANVHVNSGIMNHWFYLLSDGGNGTNDLGNSYSVTGIGIDKAAKIVYRAETAYMTANTDFAAARTHTITAALNLYGATSAEVIAVTNAWHAVGVGGVYLPPPPTPNLSGPAMVGGTQTGSYTVSNKPANATLTWSYDTNLLTQVSSSANGIVLKAKTATTIGDATVTAKFNRSGSSEKTASKYVGVNGPHYMNVQLVVTRSSDGGQAYPSGGLCPNTYYYASLSAPGATLTNVNWGASTQLVVLSSSNTQLYFRTLSQGWGTLNITASTTNYGVTKSILGVTLIGSSNCGSSYYSVSLPSLNTVEIAFDLDVFNGQVNGVVYSKAPSFDVRLYSLTGVLVKQIQSSGETVQLDVSTLPAGPYIVHIYDGVSPTPQVQKIQSTH